MTFMSIPYKPMKSKICITIIAKLWPMKFVMICHLYVVDIFLIGNKYNFRGLIIQLQLHV